MFLAENKGRMKRRETGNLIKYLIIVQNIKYMISLILRLASKAFSSVF